MIQYLNTLSADSVEHIRLWLSVMLGPLVTALGFAFIYRQLQISTRQAEVASRQLELASEQVKIASQNYNLSAQAASRAVSQAAEQQNWKKAEFLANQVRDFFSDQTVEKVVYVLDWDLRKIRLTDDPNEVVVLALHDEGGLALVKNETALCNEYLKKNRVVIIARSVREHDGRPFTELEMLVRDNFDWLFFRLGEFQHMIQAGLFSYAEVDVHLSYVLDLISGGKSHVSAQMVAAIERYLVAYDFPATNELRASRVKFRKAVSATDGSG